MSLSLYDEKFSMEDFARAMAPAKATLNAFLRDNDNPFSECNQTKFSTSLKNLWCDDKGGPSKRYLREIIRLFIKAIEDEGFPMENDELMELVLMTSNAKISSFPDPNEHCYQSFCLGKNEILRIRVYLQHNDVALRLWEASAALSEYLMQYPEHVEGQSVIETGAGVGLAGLVVSRYCKSKTVLLTDYTTEALSNLRYNINLNKSWLTGGNMAESPVVTSAHLDWEVYASEKALHEDAAYEFFYHEASVLIAADVVYDLKMIPFLAKTVSKFLSQNPTQRRSIFATTIRNWNTFQIFERELSRIHVLCKYEDETTISKLQYRFPIYFSNQRSDVRICIMSMGHSQ